MDFIDIIKYDVLTLLIKSTYVFEGRSTSGANGVKHKIDFDTRNSTSI